MKAVRAALGKLEEGGSCEDAEAVCEPEVLDQIFKWKVVVYTSFWPRISQFYEIIFKWSSQASDVGSTTCF